MVGFPTVVNLYLPDFTKMLVVKAQSDFSRFPIQLLSQKVYSFSDKNKLRFITSCNGVSHRHASVGGSPQSQSGHVSFATGHAPHPPSQNRFQTRHHLDNHARIGITGYKHINAANMFIRIPRE
jgi:hypothetical protein